MLRRLLGALYRRFLRQHFEREVSRIQLECYRVWGDASRVTIAPTAQVNNTLFNTSSGSIQIEDYAMCAHNVSLITGTHPVDRYRQERRDTFPRSGYDIVVRKGAWIGSNATVLGPCEIGEDAVVAAGAVVVDDVPPRVVVAGIPARIVKHLPAKSSEPPA